MVCLRQIAMYIIYPYEDGFKKLRCSNGRDSRQAKADKYISIENQPSSPPQRICAHREPGSCLGRKIGNCQRSMAVITENSTAAHQQRQQREVGCVYWTMTPSVGRQLLLARSGCAIIAVRYTCSLYVLLWERRGDSWCIGLGLTSLTLRI